MKMHLEILDEKRINLLSELDSLSFISRFVMGEGTALSLQLGLRKSYDFDFFSDWHFNPEILWSELKEHFGQRAQLVNEETRLSTLDLYIDNVQVSFFEYNYSEIGNKCLLENFKNMMLLSIADIACMKSVAILQRGTKKDFYDLYFILCLKSWNATELDRLLMSKYNDKQLLQNFCYSLGYFDDAEKDILPESYVSYSWDEIKEFFLKFQIAFVNLLSE